jgi:intracellular septation protein A
MAGSLLFAALLAAGASPMAAASFGVTTALAVIAYSFARGLGVGVLQWLSLVLVTASAAATLLTNDARFMMVKPTVVYVVLGVVMLQPGWMTRYIPPIAVEHIPDVTAVFGYIWAGLMFLTAAANLVFALWFTPLWPAFLAIFPLSSKLVLFAAQYAISRSITIKRKAAGPVKLARIEA